MLTKNISKVIWGSAVAAFGFSLGRSAYRKTTKPDALVYLIGLAAIFGISYLFYLSGLLFFRNYKNRLSSIFMRIFILSIWVPMGAIWSGILQEIEADPALSNTDELVLYRVLLYIPIALIAIGAIRGMIVRKKRKSAWDAEQFNNDFLTKHNLSEQDEQVVDQDGQRYRIEGITRDHIELFPIGRRGKRAYLTLDGDGKFQEWTGMVQV